MGLGDSVAESPGTNNAAKLAKQWHGINRPVQIQRASAAVPATVKTAKMAIQTIPSPCQNHPQKLTPQEYSWS